MHNEAKNVQQTTGESALRGAACYALKIYFYDHYEWEEVLAVSFDPDALREHYKTVNHLYNNAPLVDVSEHDDFYDREKPHWIVEEVLFLHNAATHTPGANEKPLK